MQITAGNLRNKDLINNSKFKQIRIMKELRLEELHTITGGTENRTCMILGGLAFLSVLSQQWRAAIGTTAAATVLGCFD